MRAEPAPGRVRVAQTGFTLIELLVVCSVIALLIGAATPGLWNWVAKHRTQAAAHALLADVREARVQAAQRGQTVHVQVRSSCWSVGNDSQCDCRSQSCGWHQVHVAKEFPGARIEREGKLSFSPQGTSAATALSSVELASPAGARLQLRLPLLGSASLCALDGGYTSVNACSKTAAGP